MLLSKDYNVCTAGKEERAQGEAQLDTAPELNQKFVKTVKQVVGYHSDGVRLRDLPGVYKVSVSRLSLVLGSRLSILYIIMYCSLFDKLPYHESYLITYRLVS